MNRTAWLAGSAIVLVFAATAAQAQCAVPGAGQRVSFLNAGPSAQIVQSLISVVNTNNTAFAGQQSSAFVAAPGNPAPDQQGGGTWIRGSSGSIETNTTGNYAIGPALVDPDGQGSRGACRTRNSQDYAGVQAGADISRLNIGGVNLHIGATAGYTESSSRSPVGNGNTLRTDFQVPFAGLYAALTKGAFFADAQLRRDFIHGRLRQPAASIFGQGTNANSWNLTANTGYNYSLGQDWFVEPSVGISFSRVSADPLGLAGNILTTAGSPRGLSTPPGVVKIQDFDSVLGRASVRLGRNIAFDRVVLQPFVTASIYNEFADPVRSDFNVEFPYRLLSPSFERYFNRSETPPRPGRIVSNRIGHYAQFAVGAAGQILNTGWLGYARFDYRTGDHVEGYAVTGGVRYQFDAGQTQAVTGIVTKGAEPSVVAPQVAVNWTGLKIGGSLGALSDKSDQTIGSFQGAPFLTVQPGGNFPPLPLNRAPRTFGGPVEPEAYGVLVGGQVGFDYQLGNLVLGAAGDFDWTNAQGARSCPGALRVLYTCETSVDALVMATGRIGYASGRTLVYAKGGAAFAEVSEEATSNRGRLDTFFQGAPGNLRQLPNFSTRTNWVNGWALGAGIEFALNANWSAKAEYMHYEMARQSSGRRAAPGELIQNIAAEHSGDLVKIGVNYRFSLLQPTTTAMAPAAAPIRPVVTK